MIAPQDLTERYAYLVKKYNELKREHEILLEKFYAFRSQNEIYKHILDVPGEGAA